MISLIAAGINNYAKSKLSNIECADQDVIKVYKTFQDIFKDSFSQYNSVCLINIAEELFIKTLRTIRDTKKSTDQLVIFFSGHADIDGSNFYLFFEDYNDLRDGRISLNTLYEELSDFPCEVIVVLDCCRAAGGLSLGNKHDVLNSHNISVLASSNAYEWSHFTGEGSIFTNLFISALNYLDHYSKEITINEISTFIQQKGATCLVNLAEGMTNIKLKEATSLALWEKDFPEKFKDKINEVDFANKELIWYSLMDVPPHIKLVVLNNYFSDKTQDMELGWLIRRAIGSLLNDFDWTQTKDNIFKLLDSVDWTKVCIGLIATRYHVDDSEVVKSLSNLLTSDQRMDVIWLANLYFSSSNSYNIQGALNSRLMNTEWGIIELWKTISKHIDNVELLRIIKEKTNNDIDLLNSLYHHLYFIQGHVEVGHSLDENLINSKLLKEMYKAPKRNTLSKHEIKNKWLISYLYGVWRDQINFNLNEFLEYYSDEEQIKTELKLVARYPLVEMKMAVLQFISSDEEFFQKYRDSLLWSLNDPHPWVRRTAIKAFINDPIFDIAFEDTFDKTLYPGIMDYILEAAYYGYPKIVQYIQKYNNFSNKEKKALVNFNGIGAF